MIYIGIDPGASGAIAAITDDGGIVFLEDFPGDEGQVANMVYHLSKIGRSTAALEKVSAMPGQGVTSMFKFGTNYGIWMGALASFKIPFVLVRPQQWQKGMISKAQDKKPALAAASRLFPSAELYGPRGGGKDGRADALLIAEWCRRKYIKEPQQLRPRRK